MKFTWQQSILWGAVALVASAQAAQAAQVVLTFDITPTRQFERITTWGSTPSDVRNVIGPEGLSAFSVTYLFDTASLSLDNFSSEGILNGIATFKQGSYSGSVYTPWMISKVSADAVVKDAQTTQLSHASSLLDTVPQRVARFTRMTTTASWAGSDPSVRRNFDYTQTLDWFLNEGWPADQDFHAVNADELVTWLQTQKGATLADAFSEYIFDATYAVQVPPGENDLLVHRRWGITGNAVLREASVVPEPSAILMTLFGLGTALAFVRRQRPA